MPFLETARQILGGDLLPGDQPFTQNSPLYPYILAVEWMLSGGSSYLAARFWTILADAGTVAALFVPGRGCSAAVPARWARLCTRRPVVMRRADLLRRCAAVVLGLVLGIAPVTCSKYLNSGSMMLLTASGGHNFYVGHNPAAAPGYQLPARIDGVPFPKRGSTFDAMRPVAEHVERRPFQPTEVSAYWLRPAFSYMAEHPFAEARLLLRRAGASINSHEATTYDDYAYQQELSAALRWALPFGSSYRWPRSGP